MLLSFKKITSVFHVSLPLLPSSSLCPLSSSSSSCLSSWVQGKLTSQGKLLQQETFCVWEQDGGVLSRSKERRVFLFEQTVIFSELLRKGSSNPGYQFKNSIKVTRPLLPFLLVSQSGWAGLSSDLT